MALTKWTIECVECGEKQTFVDAKDVTYAHWSILAWNIVKNEPVCICNECEYGKPKKKNKN